MKSRQSLSW